MPGTTENLKQPPAETIIPVEPKPGISEHLNIQRDFHDQFVPELLASYAAVGRT